jgi:hypothetical protein
MEGILCRGGVGAAPQGGWANTLAGIGGSVEQGPRAKNGFVLPISPGAGPGKTGLLCQKSRPAGPRKTGLFCQNLNDRGAILAIATALRDTPGSFEMSRVIELASFGQNWPVQNIGIIVL